MEGIHLYIQLAVYGKHARTTANLDGDHAAANGRGRTALFPVRYSTEKKIW